MAIARVGNKQKIFIEHQDGTVMEITGYVSNMTIEDRSDVIDVTSFGDVRPKYMPGVRDIAMSLELVGCQTIYSSGMVEQKRNSPEWRCDYCGRPNQREDETCKSCGAVRSIIWG
jgi:rubrerythrin